MMNEKEKSGENKSISPDTPIYFLDLTLENVRCFGEKQTIDLSDGHDRPARWTIVLGDNGTGKTTLLQCLVGFQSENLLVYTSKKQRAENGGALYTYGAPAGIFNIFQRYDEEHNGGSSSALSTIETSGFYAGRFDAESFEKIPGHPFLDGASEKIYQHPGLKDLQIYAYGASRRMGAGAIAESSISQLTHDNVGSLFYEDGRLINAEEWLLQAYLSHKRSQEEPEQKDIQAYTEKRYERVKELLMYLLDDVEDLRIKPITKTQLKAVVEAKTPYGWVDMKNLSLGYRTCIAWVVDLASRLWDRYPDSENPLEESAIVLVDEIDLHLHPKWQRTIIRYLTETFKNSQFIVTAHSPLVVQAMPENANIVLLKREGNQVVIHNNQEQEAIYGWRLDQLVTSDLFDLPSARPPQFDELLRQREEILAKDQLSPEDENALETIGRQLSAFPVSGTQEDHEAMSLIRKASELLKTQAD